MIRHRAFTGANVLNLGINGDSLADTLNFVHRDMITMKLQPTFLFILVDGGNDLAKYVGLVFATHLLSNALSRRKTLM